MGEKITFQKVERWGMFELSINGRSDGNPFRDIQLSACFQFRNRRIKVDGFYDGEGIYKIRFMPDELGEWAFATYSNCSELDGITGRFVCVSPSAGNRGPVCIHDDHHFMYADGTRYMPFGTTCYHWTHELDEAREEQTLQSLAQSPFNKVRMCILPTRDMSPPHFAFAGTNPNDADITRFNPMFFAHLERRIKDLMQLGIQADVILFHPYDKGHWGFDSMEPEQDQFYLQYVIARLAAFRNVWWSIANEYDFNKFKTLEDWDRLIRFVQHHDPYQRLRSIHNGTKMYNQSWLYDFSKPWITHQSIQHWDAELTTKWYKDNKKPVVIDEISYEGNSSRRWGNISGEEMVHRCWEIMTRGGYIGHGESFIDKGCSSWISGGGILYGESPEKIAFLRSIMEEGPANWVKAAEEQSYMLLYFGKHQYAYQYVSLPDEEDYKIELIDTWNMEIMPLEGLYRGRCKINLPGKPYIALRIQKNMDL